MDRSSEFQVSWLKKPHSRITWFLLATGYLQAGKADIGDLFSGALLRDGDWGLWYSGGFLLYSECMYPVLCFYFI